MKRRQTNPALSLSPTLTALAMVTWSLVLPQAAHAECDFDKPVGGCRGKITIDKASGSKGSYSAELTVSSTQSCSKVEFFLDNTPHC